MSATVLTSPFFRGLFLSYLILICAAIGIVGFVGAQQLRSSYLERARQSLRDETQLLARILASDLRANRAALRFYRDLGWEPTGTAAGVTVRYVRLRQPG